MKMRVFTILLLTFSFSISLVWADKVDSDSPQPIEIIKKDFTPKQPRHLIVPSIECYYYCGVLYFAFNENIGNAEIIVTSEDKNWLEILSSSDRMIEICISNGDAGSYTIEIITEHGEYFVGDFIRQ